VGSNSIISRGSRSRKAVGVVCAIDISLLVTDGDSRVSGEIGTKREAMGG